MKLQGSIVALITPFYEDGTVNFERLGKILDWYIAQGTDGILVLGTTGESSTMSHEEDDAVCRFTIGRVAGRVPVIAGSGSNSTETQLEKSKKYAAMGADALLCITPYYIKANADAFAVPGKEKRQSRLFYFEWTHFEPGSFASDDESNLALTVDEACRGQFVSRCRALGSLEESRAAFAIDGALAGAGAGGGAGRLRDAWCGRGNRQIGTEIAPVGLARPISTCGRFDLIHYVSRR